MKNKQLFDKTIGILVNAYMNNTLAHGSCMACAVGNLIAANNGLVVNLENRENENATWNEDISSPWYHIVIGSRNMGGRKIGLSQILSTGYSISNIIEIENSFESAIKLDGERTFNGLMLVCDTIMQIHEATTEEITEAKQLFVKA